MGGLALIIATSGVAYGAIPSSDGSVKSCYAKTDGLLLGIPHSKGDVRIIDSGEACRAYEQQISLASAAQIDALAARVATLENTLSKVSYSASGLHGHPTLKIDGANLQIVNGSGNTYLNPNSLGNLFIGYDDSASDQGGSHNLVIGDGHTVTSVGGLVAGADNTISEIASSVTGGRFNIASGQYSSVTGGLANEARQTYASVTGGQENIASAIVSSVTGGFENEASGLEASVSGGAHNTARGLGASILGGNTNDVGADLETYPAGP